LKTPPPDPESSAVPEKTNGAAAPEPSAYRFTEPELSFFRQRIIQLNAMSAAMSDHLALVCAQQGLKGPWRLNADNTGLIRHVERPERAPETPDPTPPVN